jgi:TrmH family RNA methyltransferase
LLSKAKIKLIRSLEQKKYRYQNRLFLVEGDKNVREMLGSSLYVRCILAKAAWIEELPGHLISNQVEVIAVEEKELSQISFLKTPNQAVALVEIPTHEIVFTDIVSGLSLFLDRVQDPGNLGTIIRIADWFGIQHVICGEGCADPYNPKTVQSTMGALTRVKVYVSNVLFFEQLKNSFPDFPIYGTFLDGNNIYKESLNEKAVIIMGNESKGISKDIGFYVNKRILIPSYPAGEDTSESLNVATAAAIVCSEFRRKFSY